MKAQDVALLSGMLIEQLRKSMEKSLVCYSGTVYPAA